MNRKSAFVISIAVLWASAALGLGHVLTQWPVWTSFASVPHTQTESEKVLQSQPSSAPTSVEAVRGLQAQIWRTAGHDWSQGYLDGTTVAENGTGIELLRGVAKGSYSSQIHSVPFPVSAVSWKWQGVYPQSSEVIIETRLRIDDQEWSAWQVISLSHDAQEPGGPWVSELLLAPVSGDAGTGSPRVSQVQYRVNIRRSLDGTSPMIESLALSLLNSERGPQLKVAKAILLPQEADGGVPRPSIISRAGWGADESFTDWEPEYRAPKKVIIHHTVTQGSDALVALRAIHYYHAVTCQWGDIGYNYLIDAEGNIYEGRQGGEGVVGGHARPYNEGSIGIALIGDFTNLALSEAAEQAVIEILAWIADRYGITPLGDDAAWGLALPNILGHRDVSSTTCPGDQVYRRLQYARAMAQERLLAYPPAVTISSPRPGSTTSGVIRVEARSSSPILEKMELHLDGQVVTTSGDSPLVWEWDTTDLRDGQHMLRVAVLGKHNLRGEDARTIMVDNSPPRGSMLIEGGAPYTHDAHVSLSMTAADDGVGVTEVELAEDGEWCIKDAFRPRTDWWLSPGDGPRTVSVRFLDGAGNPSAVYSDTIILDSSPPEWSDSATSGSDGLVAEVWDESSGLVLSSAEYSVCSEGYAGWEPWNSIHSSRTGQTERHYTLTVPANALASGAIRFRMMDRAGNWSVSPTYNTSSTTGSGEAALSLPRRAQRWMRGGGTEQ